MPLEADQQRHLDAAQGYIALGMHLEANEELEQIDPFCRALPAVLAVRLAVYEAAAKWELSEAVAKRLWDADPTNAQWAISLAYATRRLRSLEAAKVILLTASAEHSEEPIIHYNLACYECQLGDLDAAKEHLKLAIELQPKCRDIALDDPDLEPFWHRISAL